MIDIHLHLDGSLAVEDYLDLALSEGINLPINFPHCIYVPMKPCLPEFHA